MTARKSQKRSRRTKSKKLSQANIVPLLCLPTVEDRLRGISTHATLLYSRAKLIADADSDLEEQARADALLEVAEHAYWLAKALPEPILKGPALNDDQAKAVSQIEGPGR